MTYVEKIKEMFVDQIHNKLFGIMRKAANFTR